MGRIEIARLEHVMDELSAIVNSQSEEEVILVSCKEAARLLGVTPKTISMMLRDGRLKKTTIGGSTGILLAAIRDKQTQ